MSQEAQTRCSSCGTALTAAEVQFHAAVCGSCSSRIAASAQVENKQPSAEATAAESIENAPMWIKLIGMVLAIGWLTGVLWGIAAYYFGYRAFPKATPYSGQQLDLPDSEGKRWGIIIIFVLGMALPAAHLVFGYLYAGYLYTQGARVAASRQSDQTATG